jgi:hypothetical protein
MRRAPAPACSHHQPVTNGVITILILAGIAVMIRAQKRLLSDGQ